MGRIDIDDAVKTAQRFADASQRQAAIRGDISDAKGLDRRHDFMHASGRVFFESVIEGSDLFPMRYLGVGQLAARAVGRIHLPPGDGYGDGYATGFLVAPNILLTNQHVLRTIDWARAATLTMDAEDGLDALPRPPRLFRFDPDSLYVADPDLDFCFVAVSPRSVDGYALAEFGYLRLFGMTGKVVRDEYASIIQHPNGRQKHLAIRNNKITVYVYDDDLTLEEQAKNEFIYYSTDTLRGSSGAPVLSDQWYVIAVHRRGVPEVKVRGGAAVVMRRNMKPAFEDDPDEVIKYVSNEGIRVSRILKRVAAIGEKEGHADRAAAHELFQALTDAAGKVSDGPCSFPSAVLPLPDSARGGAVRGVSGRGIRAGVRALDDEGLEITRRKLTVFPEGTGYDANFLEGHAIPLPRPSNHLAAELARRTDKPGEYLLPFRHFTTAMHAGRRLPVFAAVNIAGTRRPRGGMPKRPQWSYDPRIAEEHQPDDSVFSQMVQRGHMAAREYIFWGDAEERAQADVHSFTLTNVCPQIAQFNGHREWYEVEREVVGGAKADKTRVTEFVGPILRATDPDYDDLRGPGSGAAHGTRIRIPLKFWKIIVWVEQGQLQHRALILDQREELEEAGPLELDIVIPEGVQETTVARIAELTDLRFSGLEG